MRSKVVAVGCALLLLGLAACLGTEPAATGSLSVVERAEGVAVARLPSMVDDGHAHDHGGLEGPELVAVASLEVSDASRLRADPATPAWLVGLLGSGDAEVGDGRAASWAFIYRHGDHEAPAYHIVVVDSAGRAGDPIEAPHGFPIELRGPALAKTWTVDSPRAAETAAAMNAEWSQIVRGGDAYVFSYLVNHVDKRGPWGPTWIFEAGALHGADHAVAAVDAMSGTYRPLGVIDPFSPVATVQGTISGTLSESSPTAEHDLAIEAPGHKKMKFVIDVPGSANNFDVVAVGPDGQEFEFWWESGNRQSRWQTYDVSDGDWKLKLTLRQGEAQAYTVHWCSVGATRCDGL